MTDIYEVQNWMKRAEEEQNIWENKARENIRFYASQQWDSKDISQLQKEKRPALTINKLFPIINFLSGYQRQNRFDITVNPKKLATKGEAELLTEVIKQILDVNNGDLEISRQFLDGILTGRGWLGGYIDYRDDPITGELRIERIDPFDMYPDPDFTKYDLSDAEYIIKVLWLPYKRILNEFPDKAEELAVSRLDSNKDINFYGMEKSKYEESQGITGVLKESKIKVIECWHKIIKDVFYILNEQTGIFFPVWSEEEAKGIIESNPFIPLKVLQRKKDVLILTTTCGNVILQDIENPIGNVDFFPFVPFFPYKLDKSFDIQDAEIGVLDNLKDLQREINKRRSQSLHIVNTMAHSGWLNKEGYGADPNKLREFGSTPGIVIQYKDIPPQQIGAPPPSQGHILAEEQATKDIKEISGINPDLLGYKSDRQEPGIVLQLRQQQGIVVIESLFDNFKLSHKILGKCIIDLVVKSGAYTPTEILNIIDIESDKEKLTAIQSLFNDTYAKKYKVSINLQPSSPSVRLTNFYKLIEVSKMFPVPPDILIKASDIPYADELLDRIKQAQQQAQQQPPAQAGGTPATPPLTNIVGGGLK